MRKLMLLTALIGSLLNAHAQHISIDQITTTDTEGGVIINLSTTSSSGSGYIGYVYNLDGNTINLSACYWFNALSVITPLSNNLFVEVPHGGTYDLNVLLIHSTNQTDCDYSGSEPIYSTSFLSSANFNGQNAGLALYPNPTTGKVAFQNNDVVIQSVKTFDHLGRLVKTTSDRNIDFTTLEDGIYLVSIETENGTFTQKIVVKK